jgi:hypothetical protein
MHDVFLIRIREQVDGKRSTVDIHWNVHLKVEHFDDVRFLLLELWWFFFKD